MTHDPKIIPSQVGEFQRHWDMNCQKGYIAVSAFEGRGVMMSNIMTGEGAISNQLSWWKATTAL